MSGVDLEWQLRNVNAILDSTEARRVKAEARVKTLENLCAEIVRIEPRLSIWSWNQLQAAMRGESIDETSILAGCGEPGPEPLLPNVDEDRCLVHGPMSDEPPDDDEGPSAPEGDARKEGES